MDGWMDGPRTEAYYYSSITGSRWYRAQLRGAQFGTPNRAPASRGPDNTTWYSTDGCGISTGAARIRIPFPIIGKRKSPI